MVLNESEQDSLWSEYQIRDAGFVLDSVAKHHKKDHKGNMGTQALHLNKMDRIPFAVNRGLMTIEIEYPTDEDIDKLPMVVLTNEHYKPSDAHGPEDEAIVYKSELQSADEDDLHCFEDAIQGSDVDHGDSFMDPSGEEEVEAFKDAQGGDDLYFFDSDDKVSDKKLLGRAMHLTF